MSNLHDDLVYLGLLLASIFFGWVTRSESLTGTGSQLYRKWTSTAFGLFVLVAVSGVHAAHCFAAFVLGAAIVLGCPEKWPAHVISFVVQFFYLFFFRLGYLVGVPSPPAHTNAIMMILVLKMVGVAFEVVDSRRVRKALKADPDQPDLQLEDRFRSVDPTFFDLFHYAFNHAGILTGPYYKFRTFLDLYEKPYYKSAECDMAMWARLLRTPIYVALFLLSGYIFPLNAVEDESFYETTSFLYRLFYITPVFFNFRMRLYTGFVLSECSCIMAGLGAYPKALKAKPGQGPSKLDGDVSSTSSSAEPDSYDFESVHNIDEYGSDFVSTMREALRTWNMTVQYWLVFVVYRRFPVKWLRTTLVMVVSSMWHGVYSGYYLSLGSVPLVLAVEDLYARVLRRNLPTDGQKKAYDWCAWFWRMQWFSYLGMAFQLLRIDATIRFWHSIAYAGHLVLPVFYLIGLVVVKPVVRAVWGKAPEKVD